MTDLSKTVCLRTGLTLSLLALAGCRTGGDPGLPKLALTHAMGMMPAVTWYAANGLFPLTDYARTKGPNEFSLQYGGSRRTQGLGFFYGFLRRDSTYDFNAPYQVWLDRKQTAKHPDFVPRNPGYMEDRYLWDLEMAEEMGLDGFGLCLSGNEPSYTHAVHWFTTLEKMIKTRPATHLRLTLAICGDDLPTTANPQKYAWLKKFMAEFGNSPAWLRHNGRLVLMGYHSQISWDAKTGSDPAQIRDAIARHKVLFAGLGIDPIFIFDGPEYVPKGATPQTLQTVADLVCDHFAGYSCWGGVIPEETYRMNYPAIAETVNRRGKTWMMPILDIHSGVDQFYRSEPGVERLLGTWDFAAQTRARAVQLVTWNDTAEATGFQPTISFNYALWGLTAKFIHRFKTGDFPPSREDELFLFYRKYHADADPRLYPRATVERDKDKWGETDDMLHVIAFAVADGTLEVTGTAEGTSRRPLRKGFNEFKLVTAIDREIAAHVVRGGKVIHTVVSPERVTDRPYREDLLPWGWSSACRRLYDRDFGTNFYPISYYSQRYNDGIPDWFRLHYFGTTELRAGLRATDDPDKDGIDNLHEYLIEESPIATNPVYAAGFRWDEFAQALRPVPNQPRPMRINLNPFPDKNGKLVHGFLYATNAVFDGVYPWMVKWNNEVPGVPTGWTFRTGVRQNYFLTTTGAIGMRVLQDWSGIYRFWTPVAGTVGITCMFQGASSKVEVLIKKGSKTLFQATVEPGRTVNAAVDVTLQRRDAVDFIVHASGGTPATAELRPEIVLR